MFMCGYFIMEILIIHARKYCKVKYFGVFFKINQN